MNSEPVSQVTGAAQFCVLLGVFVHVISSTLLNAVPKNVFHLIHFFIIRSLLLGHYWFYNTRKCATNWPLYIGQNQHRCTKKVMHHKPFSSSRRAGSVASTCLDVSAIDTKTLNGINVTIAFFILNHPHPEMDTESFCVGLWDMGVTYCCYNKRYMKYIFPNILS